MAHRLTGLVAAAPVLDAYADDNRLEAPARLGAGMAFLPLDDRNLDALTGCDAAPATEGFTYLGPSLVAHLAQASRACDLVYLETDYFGGAGGQGAIVFRDGRVLSGPDASSDAINRALSLLGVSRGRARDAFEAVGLHRFRSNDDVRSAGR